MKPTERLLTAAGVPLETLAWPDQSAKGDLTLVFFPGNPGIAHYYRAYCSQLHDIFGGTLEIVCVGHAGHTHADGVTGSRVFSLAEQVDLKIAALPALFGQGRPRRRVVLAGHSIGAYLALRVLDHYAEQPAAEFGIVRVLNLFPTIERMAQQCAPALRGAMYPGVRNVAAATVDFVARVPLLFSGLVSRVIGLRGPAVTTTHRLLRYHKILNALAMAHDEMVQVNKLDTGLLTRHRDKLVFYYGASDAWTPQSFYRDMKARFPDMPVYLDSFGIGHAFVVKDSFMTANVTATLVADLHPIMPKNDASPASYVGIPALCQLLKNCTRRLVDAEDQDPKSPAIRKNFSFVLLDELD